MGYPEHPSWQEVEAQQQQIRDLRQTQIAFDYLNEFWNTFQKELVSFMEEYCGTMDGMSTNQDLASRYPIIHKWISQKAQLQADLRARKILLDELAVKLGSIDDATLAEMGFQRIK